MLSMMTVLSVAPLAEVPLVVVCPMSVKLVMEEGTVAETPALQVHVPAGIVTVIDELPLLIAELIAVCTSDVLQDAAVNVFASAPRLTKTLPTRANSSNCHFAILGIGLVPCNSETAFPHSDKSMFLGNGNRFHCTRGQFWDSVPRSSLRPRHDLSITALAGRWLTNDANMLGLMMRLKRPGYTPTSGRPAGTDARRTDLKTDWQAHTS